MTNTKGNLLKNAPLKEVIFELRWELDLIPQQQVFVDEGFDEAVMNFRNSTRNQFNEFERLAPAVIPLSLFNHKVTHRFYKEKSSMHPLYQLGPGIFTVNDNNKNYCWEDFKDLVLLGIQTLKSSYKKEIVPSKIELRYIDAVNWKIFGDTDKFIFLKNNLNINAETYSFVTGGQLIDINFSKRFLIDKDVYLNIVIATGRDKNLNEELVVSHTFINNKERISWNRVEEWLEQAHKICSDTFHKMVNPQLHEYFSR